MIRTMHRNCTDRSLSWLLVAVLLVLSTRMHSAEPAPAGGRSEIVGDLLLRFNDCSNPDHKGPHTTFMVHDPLTERMTELDVSGIEASELKPGRKVRVSGGFVSGAATSNHRHAVRVMKAEQVVLEEGAQGDAAVDGGAAEPAAAAGGTTPEVANAPTLTDLRCLLIFANTADTTAEAAKITKVQGMLFTDSANVSAAIESATYGHYKLTHSRTVTVNLPSITASATSDSTMENEMVAALPAAFTALGLTYNAADYDRLLLFLPNGTTGTTTAYGYLGGSTPIRTIYSYGWTGTTFDGFVHELGHNFGLMHASLGADVYGDKTCVMGYSYLNRGNNSATYSAPKKVQKNWLAPYPGSHAILTQDATYDIYPISINPGTTPGMRVVQLSGTDYYISYRRYLPPYAWIRDTALGDKVYVHTCASINDFSYREKDMSLSGTYAAGTTNIIFERYGPSNQYATVSFDLADGNTKPVANAASVSVQSGASLGITLAGSDADNNTLTYSVILNPTNGSLSGSAPNLTYTPSGAYTGADSFVFKVNDGKISSFATVSITVTPGNVSPVASNQSVAVFHNTAQPITLGATDANGDNLTYAVVAGPAHGVLSGSAPNLTYTPTNGYAGSDSFTFKANDGLADSNIATVTLAVSSSPNTPPVVNAGLDQTVSLSQGAPWTPGITCLPITGDADCGISSSKTYTHAVDFGSDTTRALINGVQFQAGGSTFGGIAGTSATVGSGSTTITAAHAGNTNAAAYLNGASTCAMEGLVKDMNYNNASGAVTLTGLTPGVHYQFRLYNRAWGTTAAIRSQNIGFDTNGVGTDITGCEYTGSFDEDDATKPTPGFATFSQVYAYTLDYTLASGVTSLKVYINKIGTGTYHLYGFTNEQISTAIAIANLDATVSDAENDTMTTTWSVVSGPAAVSFGNEAAVDTTASFTSAGIYVLRLTVNDGYNQVTKEVTITVDPTPPAAYTSWASGPFTNPFTQIGVNQDPDGDGMNNLMEFAFGTDPTLSDRASLKADGSVDGLPRPVTANGGTSCDLVFVRRDDHGTSGSLNYTAQFSSDLGTFYDSATTPTFVADSAANADYEMVKVPYPATLPDGKKALFGRIKVTEVP